MEEKQPRRKMSTAEYKALLLKRIHTAISGGMNPVKAIETVITSKQYDWLIDHDVDLDEMVLGAENAKNAKAFAVAHKERKLSPEGYKKKYPASKQELYNGIVVYLKSIGAEVEEREKQNFRDIDFIVKGTKYKVVMSMPRKPK